MCATQRTVPPAHWNFNSQPLCDKISFVSQEIDTSIYVPTTSKFAQVGPHLNTASSGHTAG